MPNQTGPKTGLFQISTNKSKLYLTLLCFFLIGTFEGTGRLYEPVSYAQAYHVQKEGKDSFNEYDWWTGIRSSSGTCIFDDESPADCSLLEKDNNSGYFATISSSSCLLLNTHPWQWYSCTDSTQIGTICEKSRARN